MSIHSKHRSAREDPARLRGVTAHLHRERLEARETLLIAQLRDKLDFDLATIQVGVDIEYMGFEARLDPVHGRAGAETRHAREALRCDAVYPHREDPGNRCTAPAGSQVRGRKAEL